MTPLQWMERHHACKRGLDFARTVNVFSPDPMQAWAKLWDATYRGDWHIWLLDSFTCPFGATPHVNCRLVYDNMAVAKWWQGFERIRKAAKVGPNLRAYLVQDAREDWTRETLIKGNAFDNKKAALWKKSAAWMMENYSELYVQIASYVASIEVLEPPPVKKAAGLLH